MLLHHWDLVVIIRQNDLTPLTHQLGGCSSKEFYLMRMGFYCEVRFLHAQWRWCDYFSNCCFFADLEKSFLAAVGRLMSGLWMKWSVLAGYLLSACLKALVCPFFFQKVLFLLLCFPGNYFWPCQLKRFKLSWPICCRLLVPRSVRVTLCSLPFCTYWLCPVPGSAWKCFQFWEPLFEALAVFENQ